MYATRNETINVFERISIDAVVLAMKLTREELTLAEYMDRMRQLVRYYDGQNEALKRKDL